MARIRRGFAVAATMQGENSPLHWGLHSSRCRPSWAPSAGALGDRPEPLTWRTALSIPKQWDRMEYMREWTLFFRDSYREARRLAENDES